MSENNSFKANFLGFCGKHKFLALVAVLMVGGIIVSTISSIKMAARKSELDSRDYQLSIDALDESYACNAASSGECTQRIITGTLKSYPDIEVKIEGYHDCSLNGNSFECDYTLDLGDYYEVDNLSVESLPNEIEKVVTVSIKADGSSSDAASKKVTIKYTLSDSDKTIISNKQQEYVAEKAKKEEEKAAKAQEEATKAQEEAASAEQESAPAETQQQEAPAQTVSSGAGYQAIYDEYAARLRNECPTLSLNECAELNNEGVSKMADYMWSAKGTDGQYATYEEWAGKLMDVYLESAR